MNQHPQRATEKYVSKRADKPSLERLRHAANLYIGIDLGSTSSDVALLNDSGVVLYSDYKRTKGRPLQTARAQLEELLSRVTPASITLAAVTGAAGRLLADLMAVPFVNEVPAQAAAVYHLYPQAQRATIVEMGGQDSKLIFLTKEDGEGRVRDFALNTVCAAGTGSFLDQQADRLGIDIENTFGQLALQSRSVPRMAGRCSVFAKSDMIHLQQQATPTCDIIAGLCLALARNLKSNLGCGRDFVKPIVFTGGVAANAGVVKAIEEVFELRDGELLVPEQHFFTGAIGAVLVARNRPRGNGRLDLAVLDNYLAEKGAALKSAPRLEALAKPVLPPPVSPVHDHLLAEAAEPINAYLGVDVGSLSTNVVVMDEQKRILAKAYLMTAGRPLEAVRQGLDLVGKKVIGKVNILGAATTGSGRYLTGDFIGADIVINEITAQAMGAAIVNPDVDTIFEIGGQDSKYISLENGVVVDFTMNHACAAGTGSFLEEQAQRLDINIDKEFAAAAFQSQAPIKLGERCTVFMESDLLSYQQQGAQTSDLVAGLGYSIVANYLNRVVGRRKIGQNICFQGGTAFNHAVWAAFEKVTGKPIMVPDHHEVTGALGAAAIAAEHINALAQQQAKAVESKFRGFENLISINYTVESFVCEHCPNHCEIKKVQLPDAEPLYYGSRCDRYNIKKTTKKIKGLGAFEYRQRKLLEYAGLDQDQQVPDASKTKIGIPMSLITWELLPLFARFFKSLGFDLVLSGQTDKRIIRMGVESVTAQSCFPVKVAYGHILDLMSKEVDYIFLPSVVSMTAGFPNNKYNKLCPYVQSLAYQIRTAFAEKLGPTKILTAPIRLGEGRRLTEKGFIQLGRELNLSASVVRKALEEALNAQNNFELDLTHRGREILSQTRPDEKLFVLISRPYNGCDQGVNLQLPRKLADLGVNVIPMDMLDFHQAELSDDYLHGRVYWAYGQKILRAAELIAADPRLFAIYLSNFSCGPDSFLMTFFKDLMGEKPCLQLELDEHSADAGVITRLEAFLESLKNYHPEPPAPAAKAPAPARLTRHRTLYIPYMGDPAYALAACVRAYGQPARVIPLADEAALLQGRAFTNGKECLPCAITSGDMLKMLKSGDIDPNKSAFFMPTATGPCRFGLYNCLQRLILKHAGFDNVPVIAPDQDTNFHKAFIGDTDNSSATTFLRSLWSAVVGADLLHKVILRIRPFAKDPKHAQRVYQTLLKQWTGAVEQRRTLPELCRIMGTIADYFAAVPIDRTIRKPRIGVVGEIYVRSHPFANMNIIARFEELGAACDLAPLAEWVYYTNFVRTNLARRRRWWGNLFTNAALNRAQHKIEKQLAEPLEEKFGPLAERPVEHVIELAAPYMHQSFEGEAILTVGKTVEYYHDGFGGVVNVMPFTCMPSTVVSSISLRVSADCSGMPILNLSFDGQEDPTLTTRLEAFVEQVRQLQFGNLTFAEVAVSAK